MLKVKKKKYVYAQMKIDGSVKDFYLGKVEDFNVMKFADILKEKLDQYKSENDLSHNFSRYRTVFGAIYKDRYIIDNLK